MQSEEHICDPESLDYNIFTSKIWDGNGRSLPFKPKARWFKTKEALILEVKGLGFKSKRMAV
nr:hypothetical protein [Bacteroides fragilis]